MMHIIHSDTISCFLTCLDWGLYRCNYKGCRNLPNAIIQGADEEYPLFALCEHHFQIASAPSGALLDLEFGAISQKHDD